VVTTKCLAKFQSPRAITRPKIIEPERNVNLLCNLSSYTYIPNIKSISQSIAKKSGRNCFISDLRTWVTLYVLYVCLVVIFLFLSLYFCPSLIYDTEKNQKNFSIEPISANPRIVLCSVVYRRCIARTLV
jgi:magnesium-transporting ATPase (P-type)